MEDGAAMFRTDWLGGKLFEGWEIGIKLPCGRFPHHTPTRGECCLGAGKRTRRPERVVCVAGGGAMARVALTKVLKMVIPQSASFNT
jgi:hypothetical protein